MQRPITPPPAHDVTATWTAAALATGPADRDRAEAAARAAYRAAGLPAPRRFVWCASLPDAIEQLRQHIGDGHTPLVRQVRRDVLNNALSAARAPLWQQASDLERFTAHGDFHTFFERKGYYGEQRYDGVEERYDLMEHPYRCSPVLPAERATLQPVLHAVRSSYDSVLRRTWNALGRAARDYTLHPAWYWYDRQTIVDQDDEARAVVRYCLLDLRDMFFDPAWHFYPDLVVLAAIDTYQTVFGTTPDTRWEGCREAALASGPWWPFPDVVVMRERPTDVQLKEQGHQRADDNLP